MDVQVTIVSTRTLIYKLPAKIKISYMTFQAIQVYMYIHETSTIAVWSIMPAYCFEFVLCYVSMIHKDLLKAIHATCIHTCIKPLSPQYLC